MRSRNRKGKVLVKPSRVALVRSIGQYFDTLKTAVDQIPEVDIRKIQVYPRVFGILDITIVESLKYMRPVKAAFVTITAIPLLFIRL